MDKLEKDTVESAMKSCKSLRQTILGLSDDTTISKLHEQLDTLLEALYLLNRDMSGLQEELADLTLPLKSCVSIPEDLKARIKEASSSGLTDWAGLQLRGTNIAGLTHQLDLLGRTILIHMMTVGSRSGIYEFTPGRLEFYSDGVKNTTAALVERAHEITSALSELLAAHERGFNASENNQERGLAREAKINEKWNVADGGDV